MRKKDREITNRQEIIDVMHRCDVCRVGLNDNGYPYILPLNFGLIDNGTKLELIFHSALEGKKLELIKADNRASFEMDCKHQLQYFEDKGYCTYSYESVMGKGHISIVADKDKEEYLKLLMDHYHPKKNAYFNPAAIPRTLVYKLTVEEMTGKRKVLKK